MAFPQPFLDALTERNPIDEVVGTVCKPDAPGLEPLRLCPFHSEKDRVVLRRAGQGDIFTASAATRAAASSTSSCRLRGWITRTRCGFLQSVRGWRSRRTKITTRSTRSRSAFGHCARTRRGSSASSCSLLPEPKRRRTYKARAQHGDGQALRSRLQPERVGGAHGRNEGKGL